ncbi:MAG: DUF1499 domain-containing protein, partial [Gammaproteobacteria bacterium]
GRILRDEGDYLHAIFTTPLFRFTDDLECRLDRQAGLIHLRSASRVGHWDLGANRRRAERLRAAFTGEATASRPDRSAAGTIQNGEP